MNETAAGRHNSSDAHSHSHSHGPTVHFCLALFFFLARMAPWLLCVLRPLAVRCTLIASARVRDSLRCNGRRIFDQGMSKPDLDRYAAGVVRNFYDFVIDLARSGRASREAILARVSSVHGEAAYLEARKSARGAVLVTAHMGAFEVGLAALRRVEQHVHVVFKRDVFDDFEQIRTRVRQSLGIEEEAIDDGMATLLRLRDALAANHVVVMQGDRAMPGQRSMSVPFFNGHLKMPIGPIKLARLAGCPVVPVFVLRRDDGRFDIHLAPPIAVDEGETFSMDDAVRSLARSIETFVRAAPTQWLVLEPAFSEDCAP